MKNKSDIAVVFAGGLVKERGRWRTTTFDDFGDNFGLSADRLRVLAAAFLFRSGRCGTIISSGLRGQLEGILPKKITLAGVIKDELMDLGVPTGNIVKEERSGSTFTQLKEIQKILKRKSFHRAIFISNEHHLPRIKAMIRYADDFGYLRKLLKSSTLKLESAEKIVLKYDSSSWRGIINKARRSLAMKKRIALEKKGIMQIKNRTYEYH